MQPACSVRKVSKCSFFVRRCRRDEIAEHLRSILAKVVSLDRALYNGDNSAERAPPYVDDARARRNHCSRDRFVYTPMYTEASGLKRKTLSSIRSLNVITDYGGPISKDLRRHPRVGSDVAPFRMPTYQRNSLSTTSQLNGSNSLNGSICRPCAQRCGERLFTKAVASLSL